MWGFKILYLSSDTFLKALQLQSEHFCCYINLFKLRCVFHLINIRIRFSELNNQLAKRFSLPMFSSFSLSGPIPNILQLDFFLNELFVHFWHHRMFFFSSYFHELYYLSILINTITLSCLHYCLKSLNQVILFRLTAASKPRHLCLILQTKL